MSAESLRAAAEGWKKIVAGLVQVWDECDGDDEPLSDAIDAARRMLSPFEPIADEVLEDAQHLDMETCDAREDQTHCRCWWDADGPCCGCGAALPPEPEVNKECICIDPAAEESCSCRVEYGCNYGKCPNGNQCHCSCHWVEPAAEEGCGKPQYISDNHDRAPDYVCGVNFLCPACLHKPAADEGGECLEGPDGCGWEEDGPHDQYDSGRMVRVHAPGCPNARGAG